MKHEYRKGRRRVVSISAALVRRLVSAGDTVRQRPFLRPGL